MEEESTIEDRQGCYCLNRYEDIAILRLGKDFLFKSIDLSVSNCLFDVFDHISKSDEFKVVVIMNCPEKIGREEYILILITENIVKLINVKACTIFLLDKSRNKLDVSASHGLSEAYLRKGPLDADKSIAETLDGQIVLILLPAF